MNYAELFLMIVWQWLRCGWSSDERMWV